MTDPRHRDLGHQLRETIYLDGGRLGWKPGLDTGEYGTTVLDGKLPETVQ